MEVLELLAPAGDLERLKFALLYGADAVYIGGKNFSLRANAKNFSIDEIKEACDYAHNLRKKVYVTVNIVLHNANLEGLEEYLLDLDKCGIDAIIASDIIVINTARRLGVSFEVHLSTQASTLNYGQGLYYKNLGVTRLVLAREASKEDIIRIKKETGLELECFCHGAMCTSISGKCVLSNYCTNRDSNRGGCAQICRWIFDMDGVEQPFSITPKDLNMVPFIKDMIESGVNSFKVEGRMRSIYYVATVINVYRRIIDKVKNNTLTLADQKYYLDLLNRCANRDSTPQFFDKLPTKDEQYFLGRDEVSNQDFLGMVLDYDKETSTITLEQRNYFKIGDVVEFFGPNLESYTYTIDNIINEDGENIDIARHPKMIVKIKVPIELSKYDMMRIKVFDKENYL